MADARDDFVRRLRALEYLVQDSTTLAILRHNPGDLEADQRARLLRNGLAVSAFAVLEDFLKSRVAEVLARLSTSTLAFADLPDDLQRLCTDEVARALRFQVDMGQRSGDDTAALVRDVGRALASTAGHPYELSKLAFGHARSNLAQRDVYDLMRAFNVKDPWGNATDFARRMGLAPLGLRDDFMQATRRRHRGAHDAGAETAIGDLQNFPAQALGIAAGVDALLTRSAYRLVIGDRDFARGKPTLTHSEVGIRFFDYDGRFYRDTNERKARAAQRGTGRHAVLDGSRRRARQDGAVVVFREGGAPVGWEVTDLAPGRP